MESNEVNGIYAPTGRIALPGFIEHLSEGFRKEHIGKTVTIREWDDMVMEFGVEDLSDVYASANERINGRNSFWRFPDTHKMECSELFTLYSVDEWGGGKSQRSALYIMPWMTKEYWLPDYRGNNKSNTGEEITTMQTQHQSIQEIEDQIKEHEKRLLEEREILRGLRERKKAIAKPIEEGMPVRIERGIYFYISSYLSIIETFDSMSDGDNERYNARNYFTNKRDAERTLEIIKKVFENTHLLKRWEYSFNREFSYPCNDRGFATIKMSEL